MTDREMLEHAAKAAGIPLRDLDDQWDNWEPEPVRIHRGWNPIEYDGDAFRLAVKLRLDIEFDAESQYPHHVLVEQYDLGLGVREDLLDDPCAATRRAIVGAAAEIGRSNT